MTSTLDKILGKQDGTPRTVGTVLGEAPTAAATAGASRPVAQGQPQARQDQMATGQPQSQAQQGQADSGASPAPQRQDKAQAGGVGVTGQGKQGGEPDAQATKPRMGYKEMIMEMYPSPDDDLLTEQERKRKKREKLFAAIDDGISAMSNLYFTTQYAPDMFSGVKTASQKTRERWEKLEKERKEDRKAYLAWLMRAQQADEAYDDNERAWKRQLGLDEDKRKRDDEADERARAEEDRKKAEEDRKEKLHPFAVREAEGKAKVAEAEADHADEYQKSRIRRNDAAASASRSRAGYYDTGGSGGNRYYVEFRGKSYKTQADYEKAVMAAAKESGVETYTEEVLQRDYKGNPMKTRRVKLPIAEVAAEIETKDRQGKEIQSYKRQGKKPLD